jgi:tetratricopeptide (TPR) repeat protein
VFIMKNVQNFLIVSTIIILVSQNFAQATTDEEYLSQGVAAYSTCNYDLAKENWNKALAVTENSEIFYKATVSLAVIDQIFGDLDDAQLKITSLLEKFGDDLIKKNRLNRALGDLYRKKKEFEKAIEHYDAAITGNIQNNQSVEYESLAKAHALVGLGECDEALQLYLSLQGTMDQDNNPSYGYCLWGLGNVALQQDNLGTARTNYSTAADYFSAIDRMDGVAYVNLRLSTLYRKLRQLKEATKHLKDANKAFESLKDKQGLEETQEEASHEFYSS